MLRWTLITNLLRSVSANRRKGVPDVHVYEIGTVFRTAPGRKQPKEKQVVCGMLVGSWNRPGWNDAGFPLDFFDGKGVIESLMEELGIERWKVRESERTWLQPGRSAEIVVGGDVIGWLGEADPRVLGAYEIDCPVVMFELDIKTLIREAADVRPYRDIPRMPAATRDIALAVPMDVTAERVTQSIVSAGGKLLESARLFDLYVGEGVGEGMKSMAFALTYRAPDRTLTDDEIDAVHERLLSKVTRAVGGELRG